MNIIQGRTKCIDTAQCNDRLMLLLTGVGFEQKMIESADREFKYKYGQFAYLKSFWQAIGQSEPLNITLSVDDNPPQEIVTSSMVIANAAPITTILAQGKGEPDLTDGLLDITWIDYSETMGENMVSMVELAFAGLSQATPDYSVHHTLAKKVQLKPEPASKYVIDGEVFDAEPLNITIKPQSLNVIVS